MTAARSLECSRCGGPIAFRAPFCLYCHAPQTWDAPPQLERGAPIFVHRYPADEFLATNRDGIQPTPDGTIVSVKPARSRWGVAKSKRAAATVVVRGAALDPEIAFGVLGRAYYEGDKVVGAYAVMIAPSFRALRLSRLVEGGVISGHKELTEWEPSSAIAPLGQPNTVELRYADAVLQVWVNDTKVVSLIDPGIGYGSFGWRVVSLGEGGRALISGIEAHDVVVR